jgi:SAM-dependent methyltransferase
MPDWYADQGFWERVYPVLFSPARFARADEEAAEIVALTGVQSGRALDLCCGPGRHAVALARRGFDVTGVDLTPFLLDRAREHAAAHKVQVELVRQDMRDFVRPGAYDLILNLFTSFGYFATENEDMRTLKNMVESLGENGVLVIDTLGKEALAERLHAERTPLVEHDGSVLVQKVDVTDDWCRAKSEWLLIRGDRVDRLAFEHTLYSGKELRELMSWAGLSRVDLYGSLDGRSYGPGAGRLVAVGRR